MPAKTYNIVAINESHMMGEELLKEAGGEVHTLYLYDPSQTTNCCEVTPSYYLVPYDYYTKERLSDELDSDVRGDIVGDPIYVHCHTIDAMDDIYKDSFEIDIDDDEDEKDKDIEGKPLAEMSANPVHPDHALQI